MANILWIIAILDLIGGLVIGAEIDSMLVGIVIGVVCFAIVGGFAKVINLLEEISANTSETNNKLDKLSEAIKLLYTSSESSKKNGATQETTPRNQPSADGLKPSTSQEVNTTQNDSVQKEEDRNNQKPSTDEEAVYPIATLEPSLIKCPKCGTVQRADRNVCYKCGIPFVQR